MIFFVCVVDLKNGGGRIGCNEKCPYWLPIDEDEILGISQDRSAGKVGISQDCNSKKVGISQKSEDLKTWDIPSLRHRKKMGYPKIYLAGFGARCNKKCDCRKVKKPKPAFRKTCLPLKG